MVQPPRVSWRLSIDGRGVLGGDIEDALARHSKPDIFNTDQGSQFTGAAFTGALANGIAISTTARRLAGHVRRAAMAKPQIQCTCGLRQRVRGPRLIGAISTSTTVDRTRALTASHPISLLHPAAARGSLAAAEAPLIDAQKCSNRKCSPQRTHLLLNNQNSSLKSAIVSEARLIIHTSLK